MNLVVVDGKMKIELNVEAVVSMHVHVDEETKTSCRAKYASTYIICVYRYIFGCLIWTRVAEKYTILSPARTLVRK